MIGSVLSCTVIVSILWRAFVQRHSGLLLFDWIYLLSLVRAFKSFKHSSHSAVWVFQQNGHTGVLAIRPYRLPAIWSYWYYNHLSTLVIQPSGHSRTKAFNQWSFWASDIPHYHHGLDSIRSLTCVPCES